MSSTWRLSFKYCSTAWFQLLWCSWDFFLAVSGSDLSSCFCWIPLFWADQSASLILGWNDFPLLYMKVTVLLYPSCFSIPFPMKQHGSGQRGTKVPLPQTNCWQQGTCCTDYLELSLQVNYSLLLYKCDRLKLGPRWIPVNFWACTFGRNNSPLYVERIQVFFAPFFAAR